MKKPKVAIWSETTWALGRIYKGVVDVLSDEFEFRFFDWASHEDNVEYFSTWDSYDIIAGNSGITFMPNTPAVNTPDHILKKMMPIIESHDLDIPHFGEHIPEYAKEGPLWCGVTPEVVDMVGRRAGVECSLTYNFVDTDIFKKTEHSGEILKVGMVGYYPSNKDNVAWCSVKRPEMFIEIAEKAGVEYKFIQGYGPECTNELYDDIDLLIVPTINEGFALPIIEAAACGVPVISTNMGVSKYLRNIDTFETVDEAVALIDRLKNDKTYLKNYTINLTTEVRDYWNSTYIVNKYWRPTLHKRLELNKQ